MQSCRPVSPATTQRMHLYGTEAACEQVKEWETEDRKHQVTLAGRGAAGRVSIPCYGVEGGGDL